MCSPKKTSSTCWPSWNQAGAGTTPHSNGDPIQAHAPYPLNHSALNSDMKAHEQGKNIGNKNQDRGRTNPPGQNPKQNDAVDHDLYNDENRQNPLEPKKQGR